MKNLKKVLALVLAVVMIMGTVAVASAKDYSDVKADNDYAVAIDVLSNLGILDGFPSGEFKPEGLLTRAEAAKIVAIVHNSAIMGSVQSDVADLYKNAQNSFVDCNNSWALPYINYCRITGLADGMTATTYEPNRKLTGVQFLKLMLTTLNFDSAKEGFTGKGWDVNVLRRANEVGLTDGLADGWQGINELKRGEAAQILYNALTKYLVEYGQLVKNNYVNKTKEKDGYYASSFISNEQVAKSGYTLAKKMGISVTRTTDDFRRPGWTWSHGSWTGFYMDTPKAEYKTAVTMCDVLKVMGVAENSSKSIDLNGWVGGDNSSTDKTTVGNNFTKDYTALNYFAVDGFKYTDWNTASSITLQHDKNKNCQKSDRNDLYNLSGSAKVSEEYKSHEFGGQGDLTQVFKTEDGWVITTIHTFLGEVTKVNKNNKYSHATKETAELKFWHEMFSDQPTYISTTKAPKAGTTDVSFDVGTKVLVQVSLKDTEANNVNGKTVYEPWYEEASVIELAAAESKTGKLTGASDFNYAETVSIDGTKYNTNCRFVLGKDDAMNIANYGKTYTFYFDTYGNVIGRVDEVVTTAASYVVLDRIYGVHENGKFALKGDMHDMEGNAIEGASIAIAGSFAEAKDGYDNAGSYSPAYYYPVDHFIYMVAAHNDSDLVNALYSYKLSDKGVYTLTWVGDATSSVNSAIVTTGSVNYGYAYGKFEGKFSHAAKLAYISVVDYDANFKYVGKAMNVSNKIVDVDGDGDDELVSGYDLSLSESTKFVVKSAGGEYKTYTGYTALPALTASAMDYVDTDNDGFADLVFIVGAVYAADSITGWVLKWAPFNWADGYDLITVYVDGEPVTVNVKHSTIVTGLDAEGNPLDRGLYTFETKVDEDGVTYSEVYKAKATVNSFKAIAAADASADATAIKVIRKDATVEYEQTIGLTDVIIYNVLADGTVVKADASCIEKGDEIIYVGSQPYSYIYVVDQTIPYI